MPGTLGERNGGQVFLHRITGRAWSTRSGSRPQDTVKAAVEEIPSRPGGPAMDGGGEPRDGAQVAELTAWMPTPRRFSRPGPKDWPEGMRVIARRERPHTLVPSSG
jgi:hypothetical protein